MRAGSGIVVLSTGMGLALPAQARIELSSPTACYAQDNNGLTTDMGKPEPRTAWALIALFTLGFGLGKRRRSRP